MGLTRPAGRRGGLRIRRLEVAAAHSATATQPLTGRFLVQGGRERYLGVALPVHGGGLDEQGDGHDLHIGKLFSPSEEQIGIDQKPLSHSGIVLLGFGDDVGPPPERCIALVTEVVVTPVRVRAGPSRTSKWSSSPTRGRYGLVTRSTNRDVASP